jgi:hypothetical protein
MDHNGLLVVDDFIYHAVIADTELIESCKISGQRLRPDFIQIRGQPIDALYDATTSRLV